MKRVLFLCTGNSCRGQMAEVVLNQIGKGKFEAVSAGALGPALVSGHFAHHWIYLLAPILGSLAGAWGYRRLV
jgi:protein-tyrosine-phosphatase